MRERRVFPRRSEVSRDCFAVQDFSRFAEKVVFFVVDVLGLLLQKSEYKTKWHTETAASCSEHLLYKKSWPSARCYVTRR